MIEPPPRFSISDAHRRDNLTAEKKFSSNASRHASSANCASAPTRAPPALFTSTSTPPKALKVASAHCPICVASLTSPGCANTSAPAALSSPAACSSTSAPRAHMLRRIPSSASALAIARPRPRLAPVIIATFPLRPRSISHSLSPWNLTHYYHCRDEFCAPGDGVDQENAKLAMRATGPPVDTHRVRSYPR